MSIEYTIDIQLTELGFDADTFCGQDTPARETPCHSTSSDDSESRSHPPSTRSAKLKRRLQVSGCQSDSSKRAGQQKQTSSDEQCVLDLTSPAQSQLTERGREHHGASEQPITDEDHSQDQSAVNGKAGHGGAAEELENEGDNSDDSDVSETYEDDDGEEDEDEALEEEELNGETSQSGEYSCSACGLQLLSKFKLQDHMNLHTGARPYGCVECGKRFCQISSYRAHLRTHAKTEVERFQCRVCRRSYPCQEDLKHHLAINHFQDKYYECDLCKRVFASLEACTVHVQERKCLRRFVCEKCLRSFSSQKHLSRHRRKICGCKFKCTDCNETFMKKNALLKHSFSHLGLLPYTCVRCHRHFRLAQLYLRHKCEPERIHCLACLREFTSPKDFEQHKKDTGCWGNQEPKGDEIRCMECGQRFNTAEELKQHASAHQRVLKCAECGKGFRSALLLMSHMGGHAGNTPCLCQSCGLGFPHQQNYNSHLKTCGQTPQPKSSVKKHSASKSSSSKATRLPLTQTSRKAAPAPAPAPLQASGDPGLKPEGVSSGSDQSPGLWKLTLDKPLPPQAELVLFLPVCATQSEGLALPSVLTSPAPAVVVPPPVALPLVSDEHLGMAAPNEPLNLCTANKPFANYEEPFDLSKKCLKSESNASDGPTVSVKSEPEEWEVSTRSFEGQASIKCDLATFPEVKRIKMDPLDLSMCSGAIRDVKKEPDDH